MKVVLAEETFQGAQNLANQWTAEDISRPLLSFEKPLLWITYWKGQLSSWHSMCLESLQWTNIHLRHAQIWVFVDSTDLQTPENQDWIQTFLKHMAKHRALFECQSDAIQFRPWTEELLVPELRQTILTSKKSDRLSLALYSDIVRLSFVYTQSGIYFDLDMLFLRNFDPVIRKVFDDVVMYRWSTEAYINTAFLMSFKIHDPRLMNFIQECNRRQKQGGQTGRFLLKDNLDITVLPCAFLDPLWIPNPMKMNLESIFQECTHSDFAQFFESIDDFQIVHWHNHWTHTLSEKSYLARLFQKVLQTQRILT